MENVINHKISIQDIDQKCQLSKRLTRAPKMSPLKRRSINSLQGSMKTLFAIVHPLEVRYDPKLVEHCTTDIQQLPHSNIVVAPILVPSRINRNPKQVNNDAKEFLH